MTRFTENVYDMCLERLIVVYITKAHGNDRYKVCCEWQVAFLEWDSVRLRQKPWPCGFHVNDFVCVRGSL